MKKPLCIDLFCGLGGWAEGFLAEGWQVVGFDIERHDYGTGGYPDQLVLQDVLTLHGSQFRNADCIVASPPCQAYSYRAMPWKRAKALPPPDNTLFKACFRIQREASEAAGRYIPLVIENVNGAQRWVGRATWHFGSFYLWGDVPALMPVTLGRKNNGSSRFAVAYNTTSGHEQNPDGWKNPANTKWRENGCNEENCMVPSRIDGYKNPRNWWSDGAGNLSATTSSHSRARKAASAQIAKIPFPLANWIARVYKPAA